MLPLKGLAMLNSASRSHRDYSRRGWAFFIGGNELRGRDEGGIQSMILQVCHVGMVVSCILRVFVGRGLKLRGADAVVPYLMPEVSFPLGIYKRQD